jgi:hypothetical protein
MARRMIGQLNEPFLISIKRQQYVSLLKQQAAAWNAVTSDLSSRHPPVNCANLHPTQLRHFTLR